MRAFPPKPSSFHGRAAEMRTLEHVVREQHPTVLALIGSGGSGKTTLASALGHRLRGFFEGRLVWVRIGAWSVSTALEMMELQLGLSGDHRTARRRIRRALGEGPTFVVLDNHESDDVTAGVLAALGELPVTWVITARRCLLGGVTIVPVVPPLMGVRRSAFPAVASLTRLLRWHAVALDIADGLVTERGMRVQELERRLARRHLERVVPIEHEDDIPEVRAVVAEAMHLATPVGRRMLAILASMGGDHMDRASLELLARAPGRAKSARGAKPRSALDDLLELRIVQTPQPDRYTLHATVRYAVRKVASFDEDVIANHYLELLEREPARVAAEQTHLFALMDWAQARSNLRDILRVRAVAEAQDLE